MFNLQNEKMYLVIIGLLVVLGIAVFLINYQIKVTVRSELTMMKKRRFKKLQHMKMRQEKEMMHRKRHENNQQEMDSYIDPVNQEQYEEDEQYEDNHAPARFTQNDISQRDLVEAR
jgi:hypothetical protein